MNVSINRRQFLGDFGKTALFCAGCALFPGLSGSGAARAATLEKGRIGKVLSPYFTPLGNSSIRCELCPHSCEVAIGERGLCEVRENIEGKYYSLVYGNPCAVHVDPIEKKPFFHVLPGTQSFSVATAGCNFDCKFCQNWEISQARPEETHNYELSPERAAASALQYNCRSIASTYVEPTIFMEYMLAMGREARKHAVLNVMHSNGFVNPKPLADLCDVLDAACIDLKGFTESYYQEMTGGHLQPVLDTLKTLRDRGIHTEIVNLMVTGKNDDPDQVKAMCEWIFRELGPEVPVHFSRFTPLYKLRSLPPTPLPTLENARKTAMAVGLQYVYIGNVYKHPGENTYCPHCKEMVIERNGYKVNLAGFKEGKCRSCGRTIRGIWEKTGA
jgi:pyruvate formate lyase activating enzyme